jgi:hexosaminidase
MSTRTPLGLLVLLAIVATLAAPAASALPLGTADRPLLDEATTPVTIPALQEWTPGAGAFTLAPSSRVVVDADDVAELQPHAEDLALDLAALVGSDPSPRSTLDGPAEPGDVLLELDGDLDADEADQLGTEGYRLDVGEVLRVSAPAAAGVLYGTQSVLQLAGQSPQIPAGVARDWPRWPFRGFMLDNGRMYFTPEWIEARIREMAYLKLNVLHLHFSDNQGFRIESEVHPDVPTAPYLTKQQVRDIIALAARYHITVVPEMDTPGHMQAALRDRPELRMPRVDGGRDAANLNFIDPAARQFVRELMEEYLELFPGPWWHVGGDEFVFAEAGWYRYPQLRTWAEERYGPGATHHDAFFDYIHFLDDIVTCHGRQSRIWSGHTGGTYVRLRPEIVGEVWQRGVGIAEAQELVDAGHDVVNSMYYPTYYTTSPHWYLRPDATVMADWYERWQPWQFDGEFPSPLPATVAADEPKLQGTKLHVWTDWETLRTEEQIRDDIAPRVRILAQKAWASPPLTASWLAWRDVADRVAPAPPARVGPTAVPVPAPPAPCADAHAHGAAS